MKLIKTLPAKPRLGHKAMFDVELTGEYVAPCPFCRGSAGLTHTWTAHYWFECEDCDAQVGDDRLNRDAHSGPAHLASARRALKIWNTRV